MVYFFTFLFLAAIVAFLWYRTSKTPVLPESDIPVIEPDKGVLEQEALLSLYLEGQIGDGISYFEGIEPEDRTSKICRIGFHLYIKAKLYQKAYDLQLWLKAQGEYTVYDRFNETVVLAHLNRRDEANAVLDQIEKDIERKPQNFNVVKGKWDEILLRIKEYDLLCRFLDLFVKHGTMDAHAFAVYGYALMKTKRYEEAARAYDQAVLLGYKGKDVKANRIYILIHLKQYQEAIKMAEECIQEDGRDKWLFMGKAYAYSKQGFYSEALEVIEQALVRFPKDADLWNNKGYDLLCLERYKEAVIALDEAIRLDAGKPFPFNNRGLAKIRLGLLEEGLSDIDTSETLDPSNPYVYAHRGVYYLLKGDKATAKALFLKGKSMDNDIRDIDKLIQQAQ